MIPINIANQIIDGINQLNRGLIEAAKWVEAQAYEGIEDEYSLNGDRPVAATEPAPSTEPEPSADENSEAPAAPAASSVSLVQVRSALSALSQAGKTAEVRELIQASGAEKLSEVDPGKYGWLLEQARGMSDA